MATQLRLRCVNESELLLVSGSPAQPRPASGSLGLNVTFSGGGAPLHGVERVCCSPAYYSISSNQEQPSARELVLHRGASQIST